MTTSEDFCRMQNWFPHLAVHTFPTMFVALKTDELEALGNGEVKGAAVREILPRLSKAMSAFLYTRFVTVDRTAPTDTARFAEKRGAVRSAASAWAVLASSEKVRNAVKAGEVEYLCVRPFRRMDQMREFRLFIKDGELTGMSQYWLIGHFPKLEARREKYWSLANKFVEENSWSFPAKTFALDLYFTSADEVIVLDLNPWGGGTDPLMYNSWDQDWEQIKAEGLKIVPPPHTLYGDVNVSF